MLLIKWLIVIATLLPAGSCALNIFFGRKLRQKSGAVATGIMFVSFAMAFVALIAWLSGKHQTILWQVPWIPTSFTGESWLYLGVMIDGLCIAMVTMVSFIAMLVHLYSIGYMAGDKRYHWFFAYLSLFTFSMLGIVTADSLMQLLVCWELVGLTSYLLIGFWFEKRGPQLACKKAWVMNRIGDMGFIIGFGILFYKLDGNVLLPSAAGGMLDAIHAVLAQESAAAGLTGAAAYSLLNPPMWLTAAGIGLFFGAIGKSAQFPLHTWLPDAMEGPTPVSSIVHSATMVAAGVYLTARIYPILTPAAHLFVATIGLITLVMAACMALVMTDIKKVLAYSTLSQLGYMVLALGAGSYTFALFHLVTHAFFKCCLFQCAGSVIHAAHHQQDMRYYGGLRDKLPTTALCYFVCTLAIAGASIPYLGVGLSGGYYSKDGIIAGTFAYGQSIAAQFGAWGNLFWIGPTLVAYVTVFYMARSFALTFLGKPRDQHLYDHAHEAPATMLISQVLLAAMAVLSVPWLLSFWFSLISDSQPAVEYVQGKVGAGFNDTEQTLMAHGFHLTHAWLLHGLGWIIALAAGIFMYRDGMARSSRIVRLPVVSQLYTWALNKFYFDALYDLFAVALSKAAAVIVAGFDKLFVDGLVNGAGWLGRGGAWLTGWFDLKAVDGLVDGAATFAQDSGDLLRSTQVGRIRAYVLLLFGSAVIITLVVVTTAMIAG